MKKIYEYLFYRLYRYMETTRNFENSAHGALIFLSMIIFLNSITFLVYMKNIFSCNIFNKYVFIAFGILVYLINKYYFDNESKVSEINEKYKNESNKQETTGKIIVIFLVIITFLLMITSYKASLIIKEMLKL